MGLTGSLFFYQWFHDAYVESSAALGSFLPRAAQMDDQGLLREGRMGERGKHQQGGAWQQRHGMEP
jgi:hypothetical protein